MTQTTGTGAAVSGYSADAFSPRAVMLVEPDQVRLGDILVDNVGGQLAVHEIVRRHCEPGYEFAAFQPRKSYLEPLVCDRRRTVTRPGALLRIARDIDQFGPLTGHHTRVRSHDPVRRGCYVLNDGWRAQCSCGWPGEQPQIHGAQRHARAAWRTHKADALTRQGLDGHPGYRRVSATEQEHRLPPLPWLFVKHNGLAIVSLDEVPLAEARQIAHAWAQAFGVDVDEHPTVHPDTTVLNVELRPDGEGRRADAVAVIRGYYTVGDAARGA